MTDEIETTESDDAAPSMLAPARNVLARIAMLAALLVLALGQVITFVPGSWAATWWYVFGAVVAALGFMSSQPTARATTIMLLAASLYFSYRAYERDSSFVRQRDPRDVEVTIEETPDEATPSATATPSDAE